MNFITKRIFKNEKASLQIVEPKIENRPLILILPGGSFTNIDDSSIQKVAHNFYNQNFNVAILRYSLINETNQIILENMAELKTAVNFFENNQEIIILGFSAGGLIAANYYNECTKQNVIGFALAYPLLTLRLGITDKLDYVTRKQVSTSLLNPIINLRTQKRPIFIWSMQQDNLVDPNDVLNYVAKLNTFQNPCDFIQYHGGKHGILLADNIGSSTDVSNLKMIKTWQKSFLNWISELS